MPKHSLPMVGGCGCNDEEAAACGCRDEAEQRGLEMLRKMSKDSSTSAGDSPEKPVDKLVGAASKDAEGC